MNTLDLILKIISTGAALVIGIAASLLAYRQYRISDTKLKFDLYEKRLALVVTLRKFILHMAENPLQPDDQMAIAEFKNNSLEHRFLFDAPDISDYFELVGYRAVELRLAVFYQTNEGLVSEEEKQKYKERESELRMWFYRQPQEMLPLFQKYLSLNVLR